MIFNKSDHTILIKHKNPAYWYKLKLQIPPEYQLSAIDRVSSDPHYYILIFTLQSPLFVSIIFSIIKSIDYEHFSLLSGNSLQWSRKSLSFNVLVTDLSSRKTPENSHKTQHWNNKCITITFLYGILVVQISKYLSHNTTFRRSF